MHLVVAMSCEARPLIRHFGLVAEADSSAFRIFSSARCDLVVSGVGKTSAAAAVAFLAGRRPSDPSAWLNVGIAGHPTLPTGSVVVAHKIVDEASGRAWYPPRLDSRSVPSCTVISVDHVEEDYAFDAAYDMEAAGFWPTANRFATAELVQCLKVVSDSPASPSRGLNASAIESLVEAQLSSLDELAAELRSLCAVLPTDDLDASPFLARWRLTVSEQHKLHRLLRRWRALTSGSDPEWSLEEVVTRIDAAKSGCSGSEALTLLGQEIDELPVCLSE